MREKRNRNRGKVLGALCMLLLALFLVAGLAAAVSGRGFTPFGIGRSPQSKDASEANLTLPILEVFPEPVSAQQTREPLTTAPPVSTGESTPAEADTGEKGESPAPESSAESLENRETSDTQYAEEESREPLTTPAPTEAPTEAPTTPAPTTPPTEVPTAPPTEAPTTPAPSTQLPESLAAHLDRAGMSPEALKGTQLVVVQSVGAPDCRITAYQKTDQGWQEKEGLVDIPGKTGKKGVIQNSGWWSWYTPAGYFALGPAYGRAEQENTKLEYHQIQQGDYWVEDQKSKYYNKFYQESWNDRDWYGAEDLYALLPYYYYMIVIQYNTDPINRELDCAIFFHVKDLSEGGSGGCVTAPEWVLVELFAWLSRWENPHILIY